MAICLYICKSVQPTDRTAAIGFRARATLANKRIARTPRFSARCDYKRSKDLHARPDHVHPDPRAAQGEAVEMHAYLTVKERGKHGGMSGRPRVSASTAARGRRSKRQGCGERRSARASSYSLLGGGVGGPPGGGVGASGGEGRLPPGRRVAGWGGSGGEGRPPPSIHQWILSRCFQSE